MDKTVILRLEVQGFGEAKQDLEFLTTETAKLAEEKKKLSAESRNAAKVLIAEDGSIEQLRAKTALLRQEYNAIGKSTADYTQKRAALGKQISANAEEIRKHDRILSGSKTLVGEYERGITGSFKKIGASIASLGAAYIGIQGAMRVIKDSINTIKDFSSAQSNLQAISGMTADELQVLTDQAIRLGKYSNYTATEVTNLDLELSKLGFSVAEIASMTPQVLNLATALGADLAESATVVGTAMRSFNLDATQSQRIAEVLALAANKSALAFEDFQTIFSTVGPVAKTFNFSIEDTVALIGKLRDAGFDASTASTALRNILLNLANSGGKLAKELGGGVDSLDELIPALVKLKDSGVDLNTTLELTDKRSVAAFNQFLTSAEGVGQLRDELEGANGQLQEMVDKQLDNLAGDIDKLSAAWNGFVLNAQGSEGILRNTVQFLSDQIALISNLGVIFTRTSKLTAEQISNTLDVFLKLNHKDAQKFQAVVKEIDALAIGEIETQKDAFLEELDNIGFSRKRALVLWDEYYKRRKEQAAIAAEAERNQTTGTPAANGTSDEDEKAAKAREKAAKKAADEEKKIAERRLADVKSYMDAVDKANEKATADNVEYIGIDRKFAQKYSKELVAMKKQQAASEEQIQEKLSKTNIKNYELEKQAKLAAVEGIQMALDASFTNQKNALNERMNAELSNENLTEAQKVEIRKKYAKEQQKIDVKQALINGILSIAKTFATLGWPAGIIPAALAAAQTVIQVAAIKAQKFARGGRITGGAIITPDSTGDNTLVVAKQGEVILNHHQQAAIGGASTFKRLGVPGFAGGGMVGSISQSPGVFQDTKEMIERMIRGFNDKKVELVMSDLKKADDTYNLITKASPI